MSYKVDESTLIAYLYEELSAEEKRRVEAYLNENESARKELEELKETRFVMNRVNDREVEVPRFTFDQSNVVVASSQHNWWRIPMGIAASLALILMVGYLTSFKLTTGENGLSITFGIQNSSSELFTKAQVEGIVSNALANNNQAVNRRINEVEQSLATQVNQEIPVDRELLDEYMARLRDFNRETLRSMLENSEQNQKQYTDQSLQDLAVFLDIQRRNDLDVIQTQFQNFEDDAEFNQLQTNQILTNLISSVGEQPSNQY